MRRSALAFLALVALSFAACARPLPLRDGPLDPGRVECAPAMECLPDPDLEEDAFTEHMRFGWTLAAESFLVPPPEAPSEHAALDLQVWSEGPLREWLARKTHTVEAARRELDQAAEENHRQRIMGGAIVGLMYEDVSRVLRAVPMPDELETEPEIQDIYRDVLEGQASPFTEVARAAYGACAQNATRPATMRHWSHFCAGREAQLPARDDFDGVRAPERRDRSRSHRRLTRAPIGLKPPRFSGGAPARRGPGLLDDGTATLSSAPATPRRHCAPRLLGSPNRPALLASRSRYWAGSLGTC